MRKTLSIATAALALFAAPVCAQSQHDAMAGHDMKTMAGERHGAKIREATVEDFRLEYYLIDLAQTARSRANQGADTRPAEARSHHLMSYVTGPDGKPAVDAKIDYLVAGPTGAELKVTAMFMDGGYGADVALSPNGPEKVTVRAVVGAKTLVDEFVHPQPKQQ